MEKSRYKKLAESSEWVKIQLGMRKGTTKGRGYVAGDTERRTMMHADSACKMMLRHQAQVVAVPVAEYEGREFFTKDGEAHEVLGWCSHCQPHYRPNLTKGLCHVAGENMSDAWFAKFYGNNPTPEAVHAMEVCGQCPVQDACRQYADDLRIDVGIWGGEPAHERKARWNATASV